MGTKRTLPVLLSAIVVASSGACERNQGGATDAAKLVVYCSVDEGFARRVLTRFSERTGTRVETIFDSEAGKTTGLVNRMVAEAESGRPRADVFWSGEVFNTILLARQGLLEAYDSPSAADIPEDYRDGERRWAGTAVRARVLAFDPKVVSKDEVPTHWEPLAESRFAEQTAIANPMFGTTRGHVAAMFALWGTDRGRAFLTKWHEGGIQVLDSNSATVRSVAAGRARWALTDSDDVWVARRSGASLDMVYPDMGDGGTLLIPCSVAIVRGCQRIGTARKLVDFLVSAEVERMLAESDSRNLPVRAALRESLGLAMPPASGVSFDAVADAMEEAEKAVREILLR